MTKKTNSTEEELISRISEIKKELQSFKEKYPSEEDKNLISPKEAFYISKLSYEIQKIDEVLKNMIKIEIDKKYSIEAELTISPDLEFKES